MKTLLITTVILTASALRVYSAGSAEQMYSEEYTGRPEISASLFSSDNEGISEENVQTILTSKIVIPNRLKIIAIRIDVQNSNVTRYYGYSYWRSEEYIRTRQSHIDTLTEVIGENPKVIEISPLPGLLTPQNPTIALLRESGIRTQSHLVLVFSVISDIYERYRFLQATEVKAFATCEAFLLDTRTGIIPFSTVVSRESVIKKEREHASLTETMKIAENEAVQTALRDLGIEVSTVLDKIEVPREYP